MKFTLTSTLVLLASALVAVATPGVETTIKYDDRLCRASESMTTVTCSTGTNGLVSKWPTFGAAPSFPRIAGGFPVEGWNSTSCGSCWEIYDSNTGNTASVILVNYAETGFSLCTTTLLELTGLDRSNVPDNIPVTARNVPGINCGLPE